MIIELGVSVIIHYGDIANTNEIPTSSTNVLREILSNVHINPPWSGANTAGLTDVSAPITGGVGASFRRLAGFQ